MVKLGTHEKPEQKFPSKEVRFIKYRFLLYKRKTEEAKESIADARLATRRPH
jgi:hypothetical protein